MSFQTWMGAVDRELVSMVGLTHSDLADFAYRDAYDDECTPKEVAVSVLEEEGFC